MITCLGSTIVLLGLGLLLHGVFGATEVWKCESFDLENPLGSCNLGNPRVNWGLENIDAVPDPNGGNKSVLRIFYKKDSCVKNPVEKGGTQFRSTPWDNKEGYEKMRLEYDLMFSDNFDFVLGGKFAGLFGGTGRCSGGVHGTGCFSTRFMWRRNGDGEVYAYIPAETGDWFCDFPYVHCNFKYGHGFGRGAPGFRFTPGRWHRIAQYVQLNTPGSTDGYLAIYLDGKMVFEIPSLVFRDSYDVQISQLYFSTFFGGGTMEWASTDDVYTYYKNFKAIV